MATKNPQEKFEKDTKTIAFTLLEEVFSNFCIALNPQKETQKELSTRFEDFVSETAEVAGFYDFTRKFKNDSNISTENYVKKLFKEINVEFMTTKMSQEKDVQSDKNYAYAVTRTCDFADSCVNRTFKKMKTKKVVEKTELETTKEKVVPTPFAPELRHKF